MEIDTTKKAVKNTYGFVRIWFYLIGFCFPHICTCICVHIQMNYVYPKGVLKEVLTGILNGILRARTAQGMSKEILKENPTRVLSAILRESFEGVFKSF